MIHRPDDIHSPKAARLRASQCRCKHVCACIPLCLSVPDAKIEYIRPSLLFPFSGDTGRGYHRRKGGNDGSGCCWPAKTKIAIGSSNTGFRIPTWQSVRSTCSILRHASGSVCFPLSVALASSPMCCTPLEKRIYMVPYAVHGIAYIIGCTSPS